MQNMINMVQITLFVSFNHVGDYNQALQIHKLYQAYSKDSHLSVSLVDVEANNFNKQQIQSQFIHSIGQKAMIELAKIKKQNPSFLQGKQIIIQIHQHFEELLIIKPNILIIPQTNYQEHQQLKQTQKILLIGTVFEKLTNTKLEELFNESIIYKQINKDKHYIIVMLSGDAPDGQKMRYFTKESADLLLIRLAYLLGYYKSQGKESTVIVQNGPRTGKHCPQTGQQVCLHKFNHGEDPSAAVDSISKYFVDRLKQLNIRHLFYNFSFEIFGEKRVVNSFYKPLLYVAQQQQNIFIFPMQSVSMCSQLPYYIHPSRLYAYSTSSTNEAHMKFVNSGFQRGLYKTFMNNQIGIRSPQNEVQGKYDETSKIMEVILKRVSQFNQSKQLE